MDTDVSIRLSPVDESRFGIVTAKADDIAEDHLPLIDDFCRAHDVKMLIARVPTHHIKAIHAMEADEYRLMDTLLYYNRNLTRHPIDSPSYPVPIRPATVDDLPAIEHVAAVSFKGYLGHYHADPRLDDAVCDAVYPDWAGLYLRNPDLHGTTYVAELDNEVVGFMTARMHDNGDGEVVLSGILPQARRRGIYQTFMELGTYWCQEQGAGQVWFITQVINVAVQKVYVRLDYRLHHSEYTFHKWFD